ncbi:2-hydroxyacid dehydrogenase [Rosistilla oblonga]|uniref:2-hydroxyacid dehydrogenase n=1 Tax=Rosistilla oblonga TaxID=2527990 RepID=UPI003A97BDEC
MKDIILTDPLPKFFLPPAQVRCELRYFDSATDADFAAARGILAYGHVRIDAPMMDRCPQLRVISNHGVGVDHIDLQAAAARGIPVGNTPGCVDAATADLTIALMLATARRLVVSDAFARSADFTQYNPAILIGQEVTGSTLGIVGMGRIGCEVARRAKAFQMRLLYHNRSRRPDAEAEFGAEYRSLDDLLQESDFVSLNCPLTAETTGLIGAAELGKMKPTGILLNLARGQVVDTQALYEALRDEKIQAAGLDVTDPEPLPRDHPLLQLSNVIITPHLGSATGRTRHTMMQRTLENLFAGLDGKPLPNEVK